MQLENTQVRRGYQSLWSVHLCVSFVCSVCVGKSDVLHAASKKPLSSSLVLQRSNWKKMGARLEQAEALSYKTAVSNFRHMHTKILHVDQKRAHRWHVHQTVSMHATPTLAQMTQERLKEELLMRRAELDKIDMLEDKIKTELEQLAEKSVQIQKQTGEFQNVRGVGAGAGGVEKQIQHECAS